MKSKLNMNSSLPPRKPKKKKEAAISQDIQPLPLPTSGPIKSKAEIIASLPIGAKANFELNEIQDEEVKEYLKEIFQENIQNEIKLKNERKKAQADVDQLKAMLSEYLDSFIVIGYDTNGKRINFQYSKNDANVDALIEQLRFTIYKIMGGSV